MNVSDGHARQPLTAGQGEVVERLPALFGEAERRPVGDLEQEAHAAFFGLLGQDAYLAGDGRVLSCYSSSVAMEILARALRTAVDRVALVHPTFDNIADIMRGVGLRLTPAPEAALHDADLPGELLDEVGCVFVTTPNNPTGRVLSRERLGRIAGQCAAHDVVLALDTSFRGFDPDAQYDHYAVLAASGCRWVVIEDTGKLWPTLDLKIGMLVSSRDLGLPIAKIHSDVLLGVSPLVLALVREFAVDAAHGGLRDLHRLVADNRALVRATLADVPGVSFPDPASRVSVERVDLGDRLAQDVWAALRDREVHVLPCGPFHWADHAEGAHMLRIALARSADPLRRAVHALRHVLPTGGRRAR